MGLLKRVIDKWFDETDWPHDPFLDPLRDSVWDLSLDNKHNGWLFTTVGPMRAFPFFEKQESMWAHVYLQGQMVTPPVEDYGPQWYTVNDLLSGSFDHDADDGSITRYTAQRITGKEADLLWVRFKSNTLSADPHH